MFDENEIGESLKEEKRREKSGKYKALPRNRQTERDIERIFKYGTERELTNFLRKNGLSDESPRFAAIVNLFREHAGKRQ